MELFRVGGLSSEDLMRTGAQHSPTQFHGVMFRMGARQPEPVKERKPKPTTLKEITAAGEDDGTVAPPDGDLHAELGAAIASAEGAKRHDSAALNKMSKEEVVKVAASVGVLDVDQTKPKLIEAILEKQ